MELREFSDEFDVLYNSITSNQAPGLDEYEKSVFLTLALIEILISYFDQRRNKVLEGFDDSQKRQIDFSSITNAVKYESSKLNTAALYDPRPESKAVSMPSDILMMLNERLVVTRGGKDILLTVMPLQFHEYDRLMSKPYARPLKRQAWRIFNFDKSNINKSDLVVGPGDIITEYSFRYVRRPKPIILANLDGLTIENESSSMRCELDPILHHDILKRAVELAKAAYDGNVQTTVAMGQLSQTDIGQLQQSR